MILRCAIAGSPIRTSRNGNTEDHVDYKFASVQVFDQALTPMTVTDLAYDYLVMVLPIICNGKWQVAGWCDLPSKINNVRINAAQMPAYEYTFKLVP